MNDTVQYYSFVPKRKNITETNNMHATVWADHKS